MVDHSLDLEEDLGKRSLVEVGGVGAAVEEGHD